MVLRVAYILSFLLLLYSCNKKRTIQNNADLEENPKSQILSKTSLVVLGTVQDAGYPQIGCSQKCCINQWDLQQKRCVTSLGLIEPVTNSSFLFEATPDIKLQTKKLSDYIGHDTIEMPNGIFLTHGHIGHYSGLMQLGREAINAKSVPVYAMPKLKSYLENNGPWSQLVEINNIIINPLENKIQISLSENLKVEPFLVPHRAEFTETVGYKIVGPNKTGLFIPDIDKWQKWDTSIEDEIKKVDFAFLDATFYKNGEVGNRDMSEIPHPFVEESVERFKSLEASEKAKIYFIHFNHTNPLIRTKSNEQIELTKLGFNIAEEGLVIEL
ncbi:MAG: pyrroloquinoline quinone biosynthesis protein PqqB [Winogradskyella sp.]|nr:MAG: pyrroloquinoline quinone biosynthesis protein PqqB [Winogradskyella sp.]